MRVARAAYEGVGHAGTPFLFFFARDHFLNPGREQTPHLFLSCFFPRFFVRAFHALFVTRAVMASRYLTA